MKTQAVIGLGFGDEGKGMTVSALAALSSNALVVRYCGGQQAGHHVVLRDGREHVFSNFGSGTLQGCDTYWSENCTVDPVGIMNELDVLIAGGTSPTLFLNKECPVTTPYDKAANQHLDKSSKHGTCGVGIGQTIQRQEDHFSIKVRDLYHPSVLRIKLQMLRDHYYLVPEFQLHTAEFLGACDELVNSSNVTMTNIRTSADFPIVISVRYDSVILEGSQGLLLDQDIGFFPHVTRAYTGTRNIIQAGYTPDVFLVTRAYQTRHGNGPMTNGDFPFYVPENKYEHNSDDGFQGKFRRTILDLDLLKYAIESDAFLSKTSNKSLVITCMDQMPGHYLFTEGGKLVESVTEVAFVSKIAKALDIRKVYLSSNPYPELDMVKA